MLRGLSILAEVLVSVAFALLMVALATTIEVSPLDRVGQVSGLAGLQLRFAVLGLALLLALIVTARWGALSPLVGRLVPAAVAGLSSGLVAGALVVALRGTSWGLGGGDTGALIGWARSLIDTGTMPYSYPPGFPHLLAWYTELRGGSPEHSMKVLQIIATALFGPAGYLAWRMLLRPMWALGLGVAAALPLIEPYKPYTTLMLAVLIPVLLTLLRQLRRSGDASWRRLVISGVALGAALGLIFLGYSGWFLWSAPGVLVAALVVFPWRRGWSRGLTLTGVTVAVFLLVAHRHLIALFSSSAKDTYFYFDTWAEPAYFAMWRNDVPGSNPGPWPPPGELGGVGLFTVLLVIGLGAAIAITRHRTVVLGLTCILAGAWLLRFQFGSQMYANDAVQLWPRTTPELLYCLLLATGFAVYYGIGLLAGRSPAGWFRSGSVRIGALAALLLLLASAGSATGDRYMPRTDSSMGLFAFIAQITRQPDGNCSTYATTWGYGCPQPGDPKYDELIRKLREAAPRPGELPHRTG